MEFVYKNKIMEEEPEKIILNNYIFRLCKTCKHTSTVLQPIGIFQMFLWSKKNANKKEEKRKDIQNLPS